jgi:hypothetical protein
VHTLALALRYFGPDVRRVIDTGDPSTRLITFDDGKRRASMELRDVANAKDVFPWQVGVFSSGKCETATIKNFDAFYENEMRKTIEFFRTGKSPVSVEEMYVSVQVLAAAEQSLAQGAQWVEIKPSERIKG